MPVGQNDKAVGGTGTEENLIRSHFAAAPERLAFSVVGFFASEIARGVELAFNAPEFDPITIPEVREIQIPKIGYDQSRKVVYGNALVGGDIIYQGDDDEFFYQVTVLSAAAIHSLDWMRLNGAYLITDTQWLRPNNLGRITQRNAALGMYWDTGAPYGSKAEIDVDYGPQNYDPANRGMPGSNRDIDSHTPLQFLKRLYDEGYEPRRGQFGNGTWNLQTQVRDATASIGNAMTLYGSLDSGGEDLSMANNLGGFFSRRVVVQVNEQFTVLGNVRVRSRYRDVEQIVTDYIERPFPMWKSTGRLTDLAWVAQIISKDFLAKDIFGFPTFQYCVRGKPINGEYTQNPALIADDILRNYSRFRQTPELIDTVSRDRLAQYCDDKELKCSYVMDLTRSPQSHLDAINLTMGGGAVFIRNGMLHFQTPQTTTITTPGVIRLGPDNIGKDPVLSIGPGSATRANVIDAKYAERRDGFAVVGTAPVQAEDGVAEDGSYHHQSMNLAAAGDERTACYAVEAQLARQRRSLSVEITISSETGPVHAGDVVALTLPWYGWEDKLFDVAAVSFVPETKGRRVLLREHAGTAIAALDPDCTYEPQPLARTGLPTTPPAVTDILVSRETIEDLREDGDLLVTIRAAWRQRNLLKTQVEARPLLGRVGPPGSSRTVDNPWDSYGEAPAGSNSILIRGLILGATYQFRFRHLTPLGQAGPWTTITQGFDPISITPDNPDIICVRQSEGNFVVAEFEPSVAPNLISVAVAYRTDGVDITAANWDDEATIKLDEVSTSARSFEENVPIRAFFQLVDSGTYKTGFRFINRFGLLSLEAASFDLRFVDRRSLTVESFAYGSGNLGARNSPGYIEWRDQMWPVTLGAEEVASNAISYTDWNGGGAGFPFGISTWGTSRIQVRLQRVDFAPAGLGELEMVFIYDGLIPAGDLGIMARYYSWESTPHAWTPEDRSTVPADREADPEDGVTALTVERNRLRVEFTGGTARPVFSRITAQYTEGQIERFYGGIEVGDRGEVSLDLDVEFLSRPNLNILADGYLPVPLNGVYTFSDDNSMVSFQVVDANDDSMGENWLPKGTLLTVLARGAI